MGTDFLAKYAGQVTKDSLDPADAGPCLRLGTKASKYVFFRDSSGTHAAFGYFLLQSVTYDPEAGLVLRFGSAIVTLQGRSLGRASRPFMEHLVQECEVGDERQGEMLGFPFVTAIDVDFGNPPPAAAVRRSSSSGPRPREAGRPLGPEGDE